MKTYTVKYWAWPEGARIKTEGEFEIAGQSREDAISACELRWPEMIITSCEEASA